MAEVSPAAAPIWSNVAKQPAVPPAAPRHVAPADGSYVERRRSSSSEGISVAVVDANAVIHGGEVLSKVSERFVTVSEVYDEIRDPVSRHRLSVVPFTIDCREPSPEALKKVISFARATGDLQTLSDVDLKLIALTYTFEAQIHGTTHLRETPPPIHTVNVKRLPEKDMPGWGSNVSNIEEWEALENVAEQKSDPNTKILPLRDLNLNTISSNDGSENIDGDSPISNQVDGEGSFRKPKKFLPKKKEINIEGKILAAGVDASQGQFGDNDGDFQPAVSRSTRRRHYKRQARLQSELSSEVDSKEDVPEVRESDDLEGEEKSNGDLSGILNEMRLEEETLGDIEEEDEKGNSCEEDMEDNNESVDFEAGEDENISQNLAVSCDKSSEQSWRLRTLSESSVACVTSDFAMQNVILQMGLRLLAPGGMQIRELHRWILKCHACFKVTTEIGRIFCPTCGNGGTLRKVAVTVGENGIVVAARRMCVSIRGTKFSLPRPLGGRDAITKNPVLREDQLPQKFLYPKQKKKNKEGDELFSADDLFNHHTTDKRAPLRPPIRKALAVFSGKRNPNDNHYSRSSH